MNSRTASRFLLTVTAAALASVAGRAVVDPASLPPITNPFQMNQLLGRGVNLGNALEAPTEGEWGVVLQEEYFDLIKQAGFNSIRLPVRWSAHALAERPYTIDPVFMKRVDWAVANALSRGLPIIVNIHHYFPLEFTHQGAAWLSRSKGDSSKWLGTRWPGTPAEVKAITDAFDTAAAWAKAHRRPLNVGEFGAYSKGDLASRARWTKCIADSAVGRGFSFDYWEFCAQEFGVYDQKAKVWVQPLLDALIPPKR